METLPETYEGDNEPVAHILISSGPDPRGDGRGRGRECAGAAKTPVKVRGGEGGATVVGGVADGEGAVGMGWRWRLGERVSQRG